MKIVKAGYEILSQVDRAEILKSIELAGRVCYKSEDRITDTSAAAFVGMLIKRGHEAMLEHASITVKFICDRGVSHELVRHRIASYAQESTRYCNYSAEKFGQEITFIDVRDYLPTSDQEIAWEQAMRLAEKAYFNLIDSGISPQIARSVLPNSLKTEIVVTMNVREWRHFFNLRTAPAAHPQMREITIPLLKELRDKVPGIFDDCGTTVEVFA